MRIGIQAKQIFRIKTNYSDQITLQIIKAIQEIDKVNEYFLFTEEREDVSTFLATSNFRLIELPKQTSLIWEQITLAKEVKKYKLDVLHCMSGIPPFYLNLKLIITLGSSNSTYWKSVMFEGRLTRIVPFIYSRLLVGPLINSAQKLIVSSAYEKSKISVYVKNIEQRVKLIYNGVSANFFSEPRDKKLNTIRDKYQLPYEFILLNGDYENSNLYKTLRAYQFFAEIEKNPMTLVILDLSREKLIKHIVESNVNPSILSRVQLVNLEYSSDLQYIYKMSNLFLNTLDTERFGIPMLEAMACGVPVIAENTGIMAEISGGAALLAEPNNSADIAIKMSKMVNDSMLRNDFIYKGKLRSEEFTWKEAAEKVLNTYYELTLGKSPSESYF